MSREDWTSFKDALLMVQQFPHPENTDGLSEWDWWTQIHLDNMMFAHGAPLFFPWHRAYVRALEQRLQSINPSISIPYWDWTQDWQAPLSSPIFGEDYGLAVALDENGDCRYERALFTPHCLRRDYDPENFPIYYSPESVSSVIESEQDYDAFRELIEMVPHAIVHTSIGGVDGDMSFMNSPNDPIFFLHHSMVDYIWWIWQQSSPATRMFAYEGSLETVLQPFNITVGDLLDIENLCYSYEANPNNTSLLPGIVETESNSAIALEKRSEPLCAPIPKKWIRDNNMNPSRVNQVHNDFIKIASKRCGYCKRIRQK